MMETRLKTLLLLLVVLKETQAAPPCEGDCSSACTCYGKNLRNVPRNMPVSMTTFRLQENSIAALGERDFARYNNLEELYLYDNTIRTVQVGTFTPVPQLIVLYLSSNHLSSLPQGLFHGLDQLASLYLSHNHIETLPSFSITDLPKLEFLSLGNNGIYDVSPDALVNLPSLGFLFLGNNKLAEIPTVEMSLPTLHTLFLYNNSIWEVPANAFWNQPNLVYLYLDTNRISHIDPEAFRGLDKLNRLFLFGNHIADLPDRVFFGLSNLETIRLQDNQISHLYPDTFTGITQLEYLFLDNNYIWEFPVEALSKVKIYDLYITSNQITTLSLEAHDAMLSVNRMLVIDGNPWHCDCEMAPFRKKMNESLDAKHFISHQMACNSPGKFYGKQLIDINPEDLTCDNATSVVLGILFVMLLIGGVVLVVRYRKRVRKSISSSRQRSTVALRGNTARGRGASHQMHRISKPPTRPPPPRVASEKGAQPNNVGTRRGDQSFARQHNQWEPRKDGRAGVTKVVTSRVPSRPPPPKSAKSSNTDTHTASNRPARPRAGPGQFHLHPKPLTFGQVHKPFIGPTSATKQGAKREGLTFSNLHKESATGGQMQKIEVGTSRKSQFGKLSRHTSLARCLPPSQPPPPPPTNSNSRGKDNSKTVHSNITSGGVTAADNPGKEVDQQSNKFSPQEKGLKQVGRPVITRPKPSAKPELLPRPMLQKSQPSNTETGEGNSTSNLQQKDVAGYLPQHKSNTGGATNSVSSQSKLPNPSRNTVSESEGKTSVPTSQTTLPPRAANVKISSRIQAIQSSLQQ